MPKIAISYRRADTQHIVGRILDRLATRYGKDEVYIDIDNIPVGIDFRTDINRALKEVKVLLAVVGPQWRGPPGQQPLRMFEPQDPVRREIETALAENIRIVPLLIDNTRMPEAADLPDSLREFSYLNALPLDSGRDFENHITRLMTALDAILGIAPPEPAPVGLLADVAETSPALLPVKYLAVPALLLAVAYYLVVFKLDLSLAALYAVSFAITGPAGFLLSRQDRRGLDWTAAMAGGTAVAAALLMQATAWFIDPNNTLLPASAREWMEVAEVAIGIVFGMFAGSLIDRVLTARLAVRAKTPAR